MPTSAQPEPQGSKRDTVAIPTSPPPQPHLSHLTPTGSAHMVNISSKAHTTRTAIAVGTVYFSNPTPLTLITANALKKGDVLSVSRIAGIMAAKKCPDIVPLCHPIPLTHVGVELRTFSADAAPAAKLPDDLGYGGVQIECTVTCTGATGVEMEALTAVMGTALSVVDMCKAVDKFQRIGDVRVVLKEGGKSGVWREESWRSWQGE
ncbi:MoaC-domain-containing protein [Lizonia empirigonia]|nr:MoaC-domain-containing protein [Lizonia empirigonia]